MAQNWEAVVSFQVPNSPMEPCNSRGCRHMPRSSHDQCLVDFAVSRWHQDWNDDQNLSTRMVVVEFQCFLKTQQDPINGIPKRTRGSGCPCQTSGRRGCYCPGLMAQSTQLSQGKWMKMGDDLLLFFLLATKPISTQFSWNNHGHFTCGFINLKRARDLPYSPPNHGLPFWRNVVFRSQIFKQSWPENNSSFLKKNYLRKLTKDLSLKNLVVFVPNL
jgi:hypothetical protein